MFGTDAEALRRSDYIQGLLKASPMLGTGVQPHSGKVLLRSPAYYPSVAKKYQGSVVAVGAEPLSGRR